MINKFERQKSLETKIEGRIIMGYINNVDQVRRSFIGLGCNWAITSCTYRKDGMDTTTPLPHKSRLPVLQLILYFYLQQYILKKNLIQFLLIWSGYFENPTK